MADGAADPANGVVTRVIGADEVQARVAELGRQLTDDYRNGEPPIVVGVLSGAMFFLADLVRAMDIPLDVDFLALSRFGEGGRVRIAMDTETTLERRHVILVEDIVDTGLTLTVLQKMIETRDCASLKTVALFDKVTRRIVDVDVAYRGFEVGDEFLLGYGLDWEGRYRNLGGVWAVLDLGRFAEDPLVLDRAVFATSGDNLKS